MNTPEQSEESLFQQCIELPPDERKTFLEKACADPELRKKVELLLEFHEMEDAFLDPIPEEERASAISKLKRISPADEKSGDQIGVYQLIERVGQGAWGSVWRAKQREPIEREVALKILKLGLDTKEFLRRFEMEQQVLAMMSHPNIATILDAGATDVGRPYLVMELVEGSPLLDYADEHKLSIEARIRLFVRICKALHYAHGKSIIHRDIKPSNILVSGPPEDPVPKVIDFGIAKVVQPQVGAGTALTNTQVFMGTPYYCSQEQLEGRYKDVDHRSDVYSLGALLYPLISGRTYIDMDSFSDQGLELVRIQLMDMTPTRPSFSFSSLSEDEQAKITDKLSSSPRALKKKLKGDLDWIVLKCLAKDPGRRYQSTLELGEDLQAFLESRPVKASAPSLAYRTRKFIRRKQLSLVLWTTMPAVLFGLLTVVFYFRSETIQSENQNLAPPVRNAAPGFRQLSFTGNVGEAKISPNGEYVAYFSYGMPYIVVHELATGREEQISISEIFGREVELWRILLAWSPDSEQIIVGSALEEGSTLYLVQRNGGNSQRLAGAEFSQVVWPRDEDRILVLFDNVGSSPLVEIALDSKKEQQVRWNFNWNADAIELDDQSLIQISPFLSDSRMLFATEDHDLKNANLWIFLLENYEFQHVRELPGNLRSAVPSPDGQSAYILARDGNQSAISKIPLNGKEEFDTLLHGNYSSLSISRNNTLAVVRSQSSSNVWTSVKDESTGQWKETQLTSGTRSHIYPKISPDGQQLVFVRSDGMGSNIFTMPFRGGALKQLTFFENSRSSSPTWSPDGQQIAFGSEEGGRNRVWLMNSDGTELRPVESVELSATLYVNWVSDNKILYQIPSNRSHRFLDLNTYEETAMLQMVELFYGDTVADLDNPSGGWMFGPKVSPEGSKIAFFINRANGDGIWMVDRDRTPSGSQQLVGQAPRGLVYQHIDVSAYQSRKVWLSFRAKLKQLPVPQNPSNAIVWLKCYKLAPNPGVPEGAYLIRRRIVIRSDEWKEYHLALDIPAEGNVLSISAEVGDASEVELDDFHLSYENEAKERVSIEIQNPGFDTQDIGNLPMEWNAVRPNPYFDFQVIRDENRAENAVLYIHSRPAPYKAREYRVVRWSSREEDLYLDYDASLWNFSLEDRSMKKVWGLPEGKAVSFMDISPDGNQVVYIEWQSQSDVWTVSDFDPEL